MALPDIAGLHGSPIPKRAQEQQQFLPMQLFPNLPTWWLLKLELLPTLGTNPPGFAVPARTPSHCQRKASLLCWDCL